MITELISLFCIFICELFSRPTQFFIFGLVTASPVCAFRIASADESIEISDDEKTTEKKGAGGGKGGKRRVTAVDAGGAAALPVAQRPKRQLQQAKPLYANIESTLTRLQRQMKEQLEGATTGGTSDAGPSEKKQAVAGKASFVEDMHQSVSKA